MYLVSIYFDEKADKRIREHMLFVAKRTGNTCMIDGNVPPHITIASFDTDREEEVIKILENTVKKFKSGKVLWASVGAFFPYVLYIAPVLNEYLHKISVEIYESIKDLPGISISRFYRPHQWMPHTTIGKKLSREEMLQGFEAMQNTFGMFSGEVVKIGLAKTNPYEDIVEWEY